MSHPEGEGAQSGAEGAQSGTGETTGTGTPNPNPDNSSQSGTDARTYTQAELDAAAAEAETFRKRMSAADQRAAKLEDELKQLRDKDLPEAEKLQRDFAAAQEQVKSLQTANTQLALENAFLKDNTYTWHNADRALRLVNLDQVEVRADGTVTGLKEALKALATSDPYLVKTEPDTKEETPAGTAPGNNGGTGTKTTTTAKMASRLPALRTRAHRG
jgi:Phage minor structural protein GP20